MPDEKYLTWFMTHGCGGPRSGTYTAVRVPAAWSYIDQEEAVRRAAWTAYGKEWSFIYEPEQYEPAIKHYRIRLHETLDARPSED